MSTPEWLWVNPADVRPGMIVCDLDGPPIWRTVEKVQHVVASAPVTWLRYPGEEPVRHGEYDGPLAVLASSVADDYDPDPWTCDLLDAVEHLLGRGGFGEDRIGYLRALISHARGGKARTTEPEALDHECHDPDLPDYEGAAA